MKKLINVLTSLAFLAALAVLLALAIVTVAACSGIAPAQQPAATPRTFWIPMPQGSDSCPDAVRPGFVPPLEAESCDIFDRDKAYLGNIRIKGGQFYCSVPQGYVRCQDAQGQRMRPDMVRAMCAFDGAEPSCTELTPSRLPSLMLAPTPPDPT